ncbi:zonular occludens toxin domain-containing protein [Pseudomonas sp.]|uniref:zonular occludens toxin domain-containing protein n=1 Tax=Pseudomonas sp. TaxID=306 RepID=UPI00273461B5|nr:zonular occludens toxin domain-containing protein [Pseudomonas sp.]MDP2748639.1 zonular occludens toxin domain-containing protein [Pseudomonas sp.]
MIFGHEGLPRSGKSLEAMRYVCDALAAGRTVVTNIAGINHAFFASHLGIPIDTIKRLLICIEPPEGMPEEQVVPYVKEQFLKHVINGCLWFWDEINQFWPPDRQPLSPDWAKFVTEHGHKGMDICILGQDLSELHKTWRGRLERYTRFTKLSMKGKDDSYHWSSLTNVGRGKFRQTAQGEKKYNTAFYGAYKSHEDGTENKGNLKDSRFSIFQGKHKFFAAAYVIALFFAVWLIADFWGGSGVGADDVEVSPAVAQATPSQPKQQPAAQAQPQLVQAQQSTQQSDPEPIDYLDKFAQKFQPRLSAILDRKNLEPGKPAFDFVIDFLDPAYRVKERMNRADVASLGWSIERKPYGLLLTKDGVSHVIRPWPLDNFGKAPRETIAGLKPAP